MSRTPKSHAFLLSKPPATFLSNNKAVIDRPVITNLTLSTSQLDSRIWHRIEKELYSHTSQKSKQNAWVHVKIIDEGKISVDDLIVTDVRVGDSPPDISSGLSWESRPFGVWISRGNFTGNIGQAITEVDVLFGKDAVDPRPHWHLMQSPLQLNAEPKTPDARLTVLHGRGRPGLDARPILRAQDDGKFKIVQLSDTHMVTGDGICRDAIDEEGRKLPESDADPLTVDFIEKILDIEHPDLVVLTGDQLHHDIPDSQSALFKVVAPIIKRSIPFATVFGNHDSEGRHALSRTAQMSILQDLPFSLCEPGPEHVDGIGNFCLKILAPAPSRCPLSTLYFLDSHGQIPSEIHNPDYEPIAQNQIDWFTDISKTQRTAREKDSGNSGFYPSLVFLHIPLPEFGDPHLLVSNGRRREPTEGPSVNSHFYDALVREGVSAVGCGHDHVNDFCAILPSHEQQDVAGKLGAGPYLCYGGSCGFGGYCSYGRDRFHRRMRIWELDTASDSLKTWKRVEYAKERVDELWLVQNGTIALPPEEKRDKGCVVA
ncbi:hypothetical protein PFICI_07928 [Pestalotiopsis fici W106-1]|uniref:Calcineurin-like phosphoesterase domain-containing protein n=1 Tax=Pestalotiopsis fici (strain W106-1 / CGMCC3.15140) TaxID=1229662 RepID=W3X315_PESFW|nr:uncharacterized protein PFICI_07928 [Pestalotiopsis fici W106-1]ETS80399.1 hypothetical protein PFICI_07928 [Pestalotiopsis fici W106-1]